jgi:polyisoprenoid-binding protein YceI
MLIQKSNCLVYRTSARRLIISIFLLLLLAKHSAASTRDSNVMEINLDPAKTTIHWTLKDVLHTVHGTFKLERGFVRIDRNTGRAEGLVEVDARSGESGNSERDAHMHKRVLESKKYPVICFRPERAVGKFNSTSPQVITPQVITVDGIFQMHDQDHPLQIQMAVRSDGNSYSATTHFTVPYVAWGLKDPSNFLLHVNNAVDIDVETTTAPAQP